MINISESAISRTTQIKKLLRIHRNELLFELEPKAIISALSKSKVFEESLLQSICASGSCSKRIIDLLSLVEDGSTDVVESFVAALKDLGYKSIVELIDPPDVHTKAGNLISLSVGIALYFCTKIGVEYNTCTLFYTYTY